MSPTKTILRFQFRQRNRMISSNPASIMMIIFICLYGFIGLASMLYSGYDGYHKQYFAVAAIILAVGALGYIISVSVLPTGENHVNPRELAFFPLTARNILPALLLAPLLTSIGMLTVFFALTTAALGAWILPTGAAIAWALAVVINTALTIIIGEIIRSALGTSGRTKKERINIISGLVIFMIIIAFNTLQGLDLQSEQINQAGHILMWTPLAAPAGIVIGILEGSLTTALATAALTLIYLTGAVWLWHRNITTILNEPIEKGSTTTRTRSSRVLVPWAPATPTGYIYSRALRYIRRDSRMISQLIMTPILMVFLTYKAIVDSPLGLGLSRRHDSTPRWYGRLQRLRLRWPQQLEHHRRRRSRQKLGTSPSRSLADNPKQHGSHLLDPDACALPRQRHCRGRLCKLPRRTHGIRRHRISLYRIQPLPHRRTRC